MLFCKNITKTFGTQTLFDEADFQINTRERVGVVGRNGYGKSTLINLILGKDNPDDGTISYPDNYRVGALDQHLVFSHDTIVGEVAQVLPKDQQYDIWKAEKLLSGLGFVSDDFRKHPDTFSGGFQIRVKLAQLLLSEPDLLLLDEPTNYLDITSIRWLEGFLRQWKGELLCVSHDHNFIANVCTHTAVIHRQKIKKINGAPEKAYAQIAQEEEIYEQTRKNEAKERARQEKFIREFRSGARSAGLVQSRVKMLEKKEKLNALPPIPPIHFTFPELAFTGAKILEAHNLSFGYEPGLDLMKKVSFEIRPGEKIGIIGANGKGKSTLLNILGQNLQIQDGSLKYNPNVQWGFFGQSNIDRLDPLKNIIEELQISGDIGEQAARSIAGNLLFSGDMAFKKIEVLSGGERARVNLGKIFVNPSNLLLLDEPTNHLDYESIEALSAAVKKYEGAVVFVSHNEYFLENIAEKLIVFDGDEVYFFQSTYADFLKEKGFTAEQMEKPDVMESTKEKKSNPVHREKKKELERLIRPLKRKLERVEREIKELEKKQSENKEKFVVAERQGNRLKMETLGIEYQDLQKELVKQWDLWQEIAEEIDEVGAES